MTKKPPPYDCVQAKRDAQTRIYESIRDRSRDEQVEFFRKEAASGELGAWWKQIRTQKEARPSSDTA
jgi:cell division protein FtsX